MVTNQFISTKSRNDDNYDCIDLFTLQNAFPVSGLFSTHLLSLDALLAVIDSIEQHCHHRLPRQPKSSSTDQLSGPVAARNDHGMRREIVQSNDYTISYCSHYWIELRLYFPDYVHSGYFFSASSSPLLLRGAPNYSIDAVSELTRRSATGNYE